MTTPQQVPPGYKLVPVKRGLRPFSWVILGINALVLLFVIVGANTSAVPTTGCGNLDAAGCQAAEQIGHGIGMAILIAGWVVLDLILLVCWVVTRPRDPSRG